MKPPDPRSLSSLVLQQASLLVERGHARRTFARTAGGNPTDPVSPNAVCYDAAGAVIRAAHELTATRNEFCSVVELSLLRLRRARRTLGLCVPGEPEPISTVNLWNDHPTTTQASVVGALAFAALES